MTHSNAVRHVVAGTGPAYWGPGDQITFLLTGADTGGAFFLGEVITPPGGGPPPHIHHREDESLYVQEGMLTFHAAGKNIEVSPGDVVHVPRGTVHGFQNTSNCRAKMLVLTTPAGLEKFFEETFNPAGDRNADPPPASEAMMTKFMQACAKHGLEMVLPAGVR